MKVIHVYVSSVLHTFKSNYSSIVDIKKYRHSTQAQMGKNHNVYISGALSRLDSLLEELMLRYLTQQILSFKKSL